jgi:hypothetical protein
MISVIVVAALLVVLGFTIDAVIAAGNERNRR